MGKDENHAGNTKFRDYFAYDEPIGRLPLHRALAVFRGRKLEILDVKLLLPEPLLSADASAQKGHVVSLAEGKIALNLKWLHKARPADDLIRKCVARTWRVKLSLSLQWGLFSRLREDAEKVAIKVFADNLRDLLLAAPAEPRVVMGLDPGIRTGVKVALVDCTGKPVVELMGRADMLKSLRPELFANDKFGVITVKDILLKLEKPGRDPCPGFKVARFNDGVEDIKDLSQGMELEGTVSNVAVFRKSSSKALHAGTTSPLTCLAAKSKYSSAQRQFLCLCAN